MVRFITKLNLALLLGHPILWKFVHQVGFIYKLCRDLGQQNIKFKLRIFFKSKSS